VGRTKVANILLDFFMNDETTVPWFLDSTQTGVGTPQSSLPISYDVTNYPNPFNPSTTIRFELPVTGHATLIVYDLLGREVERLIDGEMAAGVHEIRFTPPAKASGVYIYRLTAGLNTASGRMVLVK